MLLAVTVLQKENSLVMWYDNMLVNEYLNTFIYKIK